MSELPVQVSTSFFPLCLNDKDDDGKMMTGVHNDGTGGERRISDNDNEIEGVLRRFGDDNGRDEDNGNT